MLFYSPFIRAITTSFLFTFLSAAIADQTAYKSIATPKTAELKIVLRNTSLKKVGFYYYNRYFDSKEFYIEPNKSVLLSLENPCWIVQLSVYQTPYYLNSPIDGDTVNIVLGAKGIAVMTPKKTNGSAALNELNAFADVSKHMLKTENEILLEILRKDRLLDLDKVILDRYNRQKQLFNDYISSHPVSSEYKGLADEQLLVNLYYYQLLWTCNPKKHIALTPPYVKYLDSVTSAILSPSFSNTAGMPADATDYSYFSHRYKEKFGPGLTPAKMYKTALSEIKDSSHRYKILFLIVKNLNDNSDTTKAHLLDSFCKDCPDQGYVNYLRDQIASERLRRTFDMSDDILTISGKRLPIKEVVRAYQGKVIYIDIWASWCAPCRSKMPAAATLREKYRPSGVAFLYISVDENLAAWRTASADEKLDSLTTNYNLPNFANSQFKKQYRIDIIPRYILFDKKGRLVTDHAFRPSDARLTTSIDKLLNE
jgi:thiol-disulfide isomerase/thioredoxin